MSDLEISLIRVIASLILLRILCEPYRIKTKVTNGVRFTHGPGRSWSIEVIDKKAAVAHAATRMRNVLAKIKARQLEERGY